MAIAMLAVVGVLAVPTVANAQVDDDYQTPTTPTTAPAGCTVTVAFSAPALPNATLSITVACSSIRAGRTYTGILASTPVVLPATTATANGTVTFANVRLPADWEVNATHTLTLVDQATGAALGSARFFIDRNGRIGTPPSSNIPRTGSDLTGPGLRIGAGLLAGGTLAVLVARRRRSAAVAA
jgi:hypothetical protein